MREASQRRSRPREFDTTRVDLDYDVFGSQTSPPSLLQRSMSWPTVFSGDEDVIERKTFEHTRLRTPISSGAKRKPSASCHTSSKVEYWDIVFLTACLYSPFSRVSSVSSFAPPPLPPSFIFPKTNVLAGQYRPLKQGFLRVLSHLPSSVFSLVPRVTPTLKITGRKRE